MLENEYAVGNPHSNRADMVVVSGCSCGGKSALLNEMATRGYHVSPEPGRQIVKEELFIGSDGLPWKNPVRFIELCISRSMYFYNTAKPTDKPALFDRSLVDSIAALGRLGLPIPEHYDEALKRYRYSRRVFITPPWEELFAEDEARKHSFADAVTEYESLLESYPDKGYDVVLIPRLGVRERADFLEERLERFS